jgi:hypothetical protein
MVQIEWYKLASEDINPMSKNTEALLIVKNKVGLDINSEKTKYSLMFHRQNLENVQSLNIWK